MLINDSWRCYLGAPSVYIGVNFRPFSSILPCACLEYEETRFLTVVDCLTGEPGTLYSCFNLSSDVVKSILSALDIESLS